jgi:tRNA pseudouridine38-40 synthase
VSVESLAPTVRTVRLTVAYDGTDFHGFAESAGVRTVMGDLRHAIGTVVRAPVELTGAGRTDAGVHAWGQVVSGLLPADTDLSRLVRSVNGLCAPDVAVRDAEWVDESFSARFSATARTYRYHVWNAPEPNPLLARTTWHVPRRLDVDAMNRAATDLLGEHDFSSFCRRPKPAPGAPAPSLVRRLLVARWTALEPDASGRALLRFEIGATSFCHQMVRSIVGTLVDIGLGRRDASSVPAMLAARDRGAAGSVAPPAGLVLYAVDYRGERWDA